MRVCERDTERETSKCQLPLQKKTQWNLTVTKNYTDKELKKQTT